MTKLLLISERAYEHWPSFDLIYEWEDELIKAIPGAKLYRNKELYINRKRVLKFIKRFTGINPNAIFLKNNKCFHFDLSARTTSNFMNNKNHKVCIVDFYLKGKELRNFYKAYANVEKLFVSSREVYDYLMTHNPVREILHLPLTLPDKYMLTPAIHYEKIYDLVLAGRQNPILLKYLEEYVKGHPLKIVYRKEISNGQFLYYTNQGEYVGNIATREDYFSLMRKSKIAFYSTPGIDGGENRTNGFNQVTPRFLEELACCCNIISRYEDNSDTEYFELRDMTHRITCYQDFKKAMDESLTTSPDLNKYANYLSKHYTSGIAQQLV